MVALLNAYAGLSTADIQLLFGGNSSSSSRGTTSTTTTQTTSISVGSGAKDPINAIQAILAQADLEHAQFEASLGKSTSTASAQAAYADQATDSNSVAIEGVATNGGAAVTGASFSATTDGAITRASATVTQEGIQSAASEDWVSSVTAQAAAATATDRFAALTKLAYSTTSGAARSAIMEPWAVEQAAQSSFAADSALTAVDSADRATISGQEFAQSIAGDFTLSVLGAAASVEGPGNTGSLTAAASTTILETAAYQQILAEGAASVSLEQGAAVTQSGGSSSLADANVTLSLPNIAQQDAFAVAEIDSNAVYTEDAGPVAVTVADATNVTISGTSMVATEGGALPGGLPPVGLIQAAISSMNALDADSINVDDTQGVDLNAPFQGNLTLVKLPPESLGAYGGNFITLSTTGGDYADWAIVLPRDEVTVTVSEAQTNT